MSMQAASHGILCRRVLSRVLYAPFHSSAPAARNGKRLAGPSRTRLAKDPSIATPAKPEFARDAVPHASADPVSQMGSGSRAFRRSRNPGRAPKYTWGEEIDSSLPTQAARKRALKNDSTPTHSQKTVALSRGGHVDREKQQLASMVSRTTKATPPPLFPTVSSKGSFSSPPLLAGLLDSLEDVVGENAKPTAIQAMSIEHFLNNPSEETYKQCLLASETGSGKSIAYLLPLLQSLKETESSASTERERDMNPRALVLAPTHELSRQLSGFAKALLHNIKLRVVCASRANTVTRNNQDATWSTEKPQSKTYDVDVLVGTPMKLMELTRGRGWDRVGEPEHSAEELPEELEHKKFRRGRDLQLSDDVYGRARAEPEVGLSRVEWVIVDEADVLFDPDFQESTQLLLSDIARAKSGNSAECSPGDYPFNLVLTTATIPSALQSYLSNHHPNMTRLASPNIHRLPSTLKTQYVSWSGGNKYADIEKQIRQVWQDEFYSKKAPTTQKSKILIFCNKSDKAEELGKHLTESGIENVTLTRTNDTRCYGSNHHLDGFLKTQPRALKPSLLSTSPPSESTVDTATTSDPSLKDPKILITTSLLSRGLDFAPSIRHVFIVDEPRNMVDFLHRAGRSGRAGEQGNVIVFGKMEGRGSERAKDVRRKIADVSAPGSQRLKAKLRA